MQRRKLTGLLVLMAVLALLFTSSCSILKPKVETTKAEDFTTETAEPVVTEQGPSEEEIARQLEEERLRQEAAAKAAAQQAQRVAMAQFSNEDIHFEFDSSDLLPSDQAILRKKAAFLREVPEVTVVIEGHCDERGSNEYNLALGDRRANSAKNFLMDLGISANRMATISYGEEKPLDPAHTEAAWAKNRRGHFIIE